MRAKEFTNFKFEVRPFKAWSGQGIMVTAYDGEEVIGFATFEPTDHDKKLWYSTNTEVDEPYQRQGIATKMYDLAKQKATSRGAKIVPSHAQTDDGRGLWGGKKVWEQQVNEYNEENTTEEYHGLHMKIRDDGHEVITTALDDWGNEMGSVVFMKGDDNELDPQDLLVIDKYRGLGVAKVMYDFTTSHGYEIHKSYDVTKMADQGKQSGEYFWQKNRGEKRIWEDELNEVNIDIDYGNEELTIKQKFLDYFSNKGYKFLGDGRDQIALLSPRNTVLKILGLGDTHRQQAVEHYVEFFERNQRNPYYPKIYNSQRFEFEGDSYFMYETEYLDYVSNEDDTLDWLERYLNHLGTDPVEAQNYIEVNGVPDDIGEDQLYGLTQSTEDIIEYLAGPKGYMMDLGNIENIRRRNDGHLVIVDPISI